MPGPDDILYSASVEDHTGEFFDRFDQRIDEMEQRGDTAFTGLEQGGGKAAAIMGVVGGAVGALTTKLLEMGFAGAQAFIGYVKEATLFAARVDTLGVALEVAGAHAGYSREEIQKFEEDVKGMGITTSKARIALQQMAQADLDLAQAADLARVAQDAAVTAGIDSSEAFNRILYAITSLQPELLRTMNLTVNSQAAQEKYARELGKSADQLTATERQQALLNATMRAAEGIAGTYEAAMETVGKKLTSLPRYFEEIRLGIGNAFQPALLVSVDFLTEKLKDLQSWLDENEEQLESFGQNLGTFTEWLLRMGEAITNAFTSLPGLIENVSFAAATALAQALDVASPEEMDERRAHLGEYFAQAVSLLVAFAHGGILVIIESAKTAAAIVGALFTFISEGGGHGWQELDAALEDHNKRMEEARQKAYDTLWTMSELTGLIEKAGDAAEDAGFQFDKAAADLQTLQEALDTANSRLSDFARKMEEEAAELAKSISRAATEAALRDSWAREDMERSHQARMQAILEQAAESKKTIARNYSQQRIDIERDYQRRIRDLQRDFEYQASELARSRDAVGLLRLMRTHDKALKDAEIERKDRLADAKAAFAEEMKLMNERIAEQLRKAEEAHRLQLEDYERMKARERQIDALHAQWAEEDRQAAYAKQLAELLIQMGNIEGITQEGLMDLIDLWRLYFGDLTDAAITYMNKLNQVIRPGGKYTPAGWNPVLPTGPRGPYGYGQGGRVSHMMSPADVSLADRLFQRAQPSPIPRVPTSDMRSERKEITVKVSAEGLEPYIQRLVANSLLEIERNASGG